MSAETTQWLNTMTLIGMTEKRGNAWHYREESQGDESNHYPHAIPVADVVRRLFNFQVIEAPLYLGPNYSTDPAPGFTEIPGRKAMVCSDNFDVLGIFKSGYLGHGYEEWLLDGPAEIIATSKGELGIGSAGLLKNRGLAWVSIEMEDSVTTPEGVEFRPYLLAGTSFDGSLATTYARKRQLVVCDNTLEVALRERGQSVKIKHSSGSGLKLAEAREALNIIFEDSEAFMAEVAALTSWKVNTRQWNAVLDAVVPVPEIPAGKTATRTATMATTKQDTLRRLYTKDPRVAPWKGTAFGVIQAFNTYQHHEAGTRGETHRAQRNMLRAIDGTTAAADALVLSALVDLTDHAPVLVAG
jgi:phage/plasmid-like protein (TIGR03299 family)